MTTPIRIGAVSYLNAKPLYYGLCEFAPNVRLSMDVPSRLAEQLAEGELDVALIPSVEYLRGTQLGYEIIPGFAIAARGPVRSVKLFSRVPWSDIERLALDAGSRTSQVLARIWLDERHGVRPARIEDLPLGVSALESTADAVLVIGDRAMRVPHEPFHDVVDLGEAWHELDRLAVCVCSLGRTRGRRSWRLAGRTRPEPGDGVGACRIAGCTARAAAGTRFRNVLRLLDAHSVLRPRRGRDRRSEAVRRDGGALGPGTRRSEPCLPPSPRSCTAPLKAGG